MRILTKKMQLPIDAIINAIEVGKNPFKVVKKYAKVQNLDIFEVKKLIHFIKIANTNETLTTLFENSYLPFDQSDIEYYLKMTRKAMLELYGSEILTVTESFNSVYNIIGKLYCILESKNIIHDFCTLVSETEARLILALLEKSGELPDVKLRNYVGIY